MPKLERVAVGFGCLTAIVIFFNVNARGLGAGAGAQHRAVQTVAQVTAAPTPGFIPWYASSQVPWPSPLPSADAAIGGAFGAALLYNDIVTAHNVPGLGMLATNSCQFICFGAPGVASHHVFAYGSDVDPTAYTTQGAPDDCTPLGAVLDVGCPGDVDSSVFSVTFHGNLPPNGGYFVAVDGKANLGVFRNIIAGSSVIAGAGIGTPEPSPTPGSLVSHTGTGQGELLLGSSADFVTCDYGVSAAGTLRCNKPFVAAGFTSSSGGMLPNGASGGYAPEAFAGGAATSHPRLVSGSCASGYSKSVLCTFSNRVSFTGTTYNCTVSATGATPIAVSYEKTTAGSITVHATASGTFSYICLGA